MDLQTWFIYLLATTGLSLSPGPNSLLALTHGALHGWRRTLYTIAGVALGFVVLIGLSLLGISALLQTSTLWLAALKWGGGAYLVGLGVLVWRTPPVGAGLQAHAHAAAGPPTMTGAAMAWQGALAALTNPNGVLFFAALLPQFIDPARSPWPQFSVIAGTFVMVESATKLVIAGTAARVRPWLERVGRRFNQICGGLFILIGMALPLRG